ncbi:transcriptional adapter 2-beta-like isoform X2 [Limulus polyphemus]|uniref:Transcriptional adapter 2-beta-like isoform X2 n=1 Tax=Limulus polyphemus TaxID=6850 RepID=A0ABM1T5S6_LIMPO|nr:transcriptional adapter 2-beta-like isoform X2 [Limulus polyphemus]
MAGFNSDYQCKYCQEDITEVTVRCSQCKDFDLCLQCFSCGVEIGGHKNKHGYELINCGTFLLFQTPGSWKAVDEVLLLEAVEHYGFGNWEGITQHFKERSIEDVRDHYIDMYVCGNIGEASWPLQTLHTVIDHTFPNNDEILLPPEELSLQEQRELGYLPKRDDFEVVYENNAESLVCNLCVHKDEEEVYVALSLAQLDGYNCRLRERDRRQRAAREHGLFWEFFNKSKSSAPKKRLYDKKEEFQEKVKVFCQFQSGAERCEFLKNIQKEEDLKRKIEQLMKYRKCGLTKLDECEKFDSMKYMKNTKKQINNKLNNHSDSFIDGGHAIE